MNYGCIYDRLRLKVIVMIGTMISRVFLILIENDFESEIYLINPLTEYLQNLGSIITRRVLKKKKRKRIVFMTHALTVYIYIYRTFVSFGLSSSTRVLDFFFYNLFLLRFSYFIYRRDENIILFVLTNITRIRPRCNVRTIFVKIYRFSVVVRMLFFFENINIYVIYVLTAVNYIERIYPYR